MVELGILSDELKVKIDWTWDVRCNEHFDEVTSLEHEMYERADYNRAVKANRLLRDTLVTLHDKG
jgi:hypothetical protein